jgi:mRNA-degrading endonuclease RelE of RelBE toxin-antitoxin system
MKWGLVIASRAERQLRRISAAEREHVDRAFSEMCKNPFSGDVKVLRGLGGTLRRRVGEWRILFDLDRANHLVIVTAVKLRGSNTY